MNPVNYCDNCGEEVSEFRPDPTLISFTFLDASGEPRHKRTPTHVKKTLGTQGMVEWPTRWGIGCSCDQRRKAKANSY